MSKTATGRALSGLVIGLLGSGVLLGIGLLRALVAVPLGTPIGFGGEEAQMAAGFLLGGALAGIAGGLLFPLARIKLGAVAVGIVAFQPLLFAILLLTEDAHWSTWLIMTAIFGPVIGIAWIHPLSADDESTGRQRDDA